MTARDSRPPVNPIAAKAMNTLPDGTTRPYRPYKKMPEWKLWAISIGLAILVTPLFVLWRIAVFAGRASRFDLPVPQVAPNKKRETAEEWMERLNRDREDEVENRQRR